MKAKVLCFENTQVLAMEEEKKPWYLDILRLMESGEFPKKMPVRKTECYWDLLQKDVFIFNGVLYIRDKALHLRCVLDKKVEQIMQEVYIGVCGPHMNVKSW